MCPLFDNFQPQYYRTSTANGGQEFVYLQDITTSAPNSGLMVVIDATGGRLHEKAPVPTDLSRWHGVSLTQYPELHLLLLTQLPLEECTYLINNCQSNERPKPAQRFSESNS